MTGLDRPFHTADRACLAPLRLLGTDQHIPRLEEVLALVAGRVPLLVELKNNKVGPLESLVAGLLRRYRGLCAVMSFDPFGVAEVRRRAPGLLRGQLSGDFRGEKLPAWKKHLLQRMWLNPLSRPHFVAYDVRCLPHPAVLRARRRGLPALAWTVDSVEKLQTARQWADNVIFEGIHPEPRKAVTEDSAEMRGP
jgi:glycerophosphoryl diester phosphodiesterase